MELYQDFIFSWSSMYLYTLTHKKERGNMTDLKLEKQLALCPPQTFVSFACIQPCSSPDTPLCRLSKRYTRPTPTAVYIYVCKHCSLGSTDEEESGFFSFWVWVTYLLCVRKDPLVQVPQLFNQSDLAQHWKREVHCGKLSMDPGSTQPFLCPLFPGFPSLSLLLLTVAQLVALAVVRKPVYSLPSL